MFIEYRVGASTPEMWAANFAKSRRLTRWREARLASWREMQLIRRYVPRDSKAMRQSSQAQFPPASDAKFFQFLMTEDELATHVSGAALGVLETGSTRMPSLALVFPRVERGRLFGLASMLFSCVARWTPRYDGMIYCVARKEAA